MINKASFEEDHIRMIQKQSHRDPILIERVIYAFGLLEALVKVNLPFIFKGGTCLMLLLSEPRRLSTDIDIVVKPGTDIDEYIKRAGEIFPFISQEEKIRKGKNDIVKRHFKFTYNSPVNQKPFYILLDVLFEDNHYQKTEEKEIKMDMLLCEGNALKVCVPDIDSILGDKLTAFAPHTSGIPINSGKDMEIMKQMYDVSSLIHEFKNFDSVCNSYFSVCNAEIEYRGKEFSAKDCLLDTFMTSLCIASRGKNNSDEYPIYVKAIKDLHDHVFSENYSAEIAAMRAPEIMYMTMCILKGNRFEKVENYLDYSDRQIQNELLTPLKYLRKANPISYAYVIKTDEIYTDPF